MVNVSYITVSVGIEQIPVNRNSDVYIDIEGATTLPS